MYSRSRTCLSKGKAIELINSQTRPSPPLDFLYPRWFTHGPVRFESALAQPSHCTDNQLEARRHRYKGKDVQISQKSSQGNHAHGKEGDPATLWAQYVELRRRTAQTRDDIQDLRAVVREREELARIVEKRFDNQVSEGASMAGRAVRVHHDSVLRVRQPVTDSLAQKAARKLAMKVTHNPAHTNWTVPVRMLSDAMQRPHRREGDQILLRERTIISLTGVVYENAWIHNVRGGCEVQVLPRTKGSSENRRVVLHGSQAARELTKEYLYATDRSLHGSAGDDQGFGGPSHWVVSRQHTDPDARDAVRADQLPLPDAWSVGSFAQYVEDLCAMTLTRGVQQKLYPGEETFQQNVAAVLERLFTTEELVPYFSSHAFNVALHYTSMHSQLGVVRELIYATAKQLGLHRQIWMYNIMIERALKMNQMDALRDLVKDMQAAGVVPDARTWVKLLLILQSGYKRRYILDFILEAYPEDFLAANGHLARRLVETEMIQLVTKPQDSFQTFVDRMDGGFGFGWLTTRTLEKVIRTCAKHELWQAADDIFELAAVRKVEPSSATIKALMYMHYTRGNLNAAIDLLQSSWVTKLGYDSTYVIQWAFLLAWKQERHNVCRVLWQYAATRGLISHAMQTRVYNSLIRNQKIAVLPPNGSWESVAGKLVIGTDLNTTNFEVQFPRLSKYFSTTKDPLQWLAQWTPNNGTRDEQMSLAYVMLHRDLAAWEKLKPLPRNDLPELLNLARRKDQAWVAESFGQHATFVEMLANVIQVPLVPAEHHESLPLDDEGSTHPAPADLQEWVQLQSLYSKDLDSSSDWSSNMATSARGLLMWSFGLSRLISTLQTRLQKRCFFPATSFSIRDLLVQWFGPQPSQA